MSKEEFTSEELEQMLENARKKERKEKQQKKARYESSRDSLIKELFGAAQKEFDALKLFKQMVFSHMESFRETMREYGEIKEAQKNFTLKTDDGHYKIVYNHRKVKGFDERATQAAAHIHSFIERFVKKKDVASYELIKSLLDRSNKNDEFDVNQIMKLIKMEDRFDDSDWQKGIALFKESYQEQSTAQYINFYKRNEIGQYEALVLDFASIKID